MVVCKRSPGVPSDDRRFVDIWGDDSLTISESSLTSENVVTVVEVHAAEEAEKQDETTVDNELDEEKLELDNKEGFASSRTFKQKIYKWSFFIDVDESALNVAVQETTELQAAGEDESKENVEELVEQEVIAEEDQKEEEEAVDVVENENLDEICESTPLFIMSTYNGEILYQV
jgi:hypothetical protein